MQNYSNPNKKRKLPKKRTYKKKPNSTNYANKMIKQLIKNKEYKIVDSTAYEWMPAASAGMLNWVLNLNLQGTNFFNRVGNKFTMKSLHLRIQLNPDVLNPIINQDVCRIMLVYDKNPNKAYPVVGDILLNTNKTGVTRTDSWSFPNPVNKQRFKIIRDWVKYTPEIYSGVTNPGVAPWSFGGGSNKGNNPYVIDEYIKLKGLPTVYNNSGNIGALAEMNIGALYLIAFKTEEPESHTWNIEYTARLIFEDN